MIPNTRFRSGLRLRSGWMLLAAVALVAGCSTSATNESGGSVTHITAQGTSVSGWLTSSGASNHSRSATNSFIALGNTGGCTECHGADLLGGISRVSCMSNASACHHGTVAGWVAAGSATQQHGASAKRGPGSSSMYACKICHGTDFRTVLNGNDCFTCHANAPHSDAPWRSGGTNNTHVNVNTANAPVCYGCHADSAAGNPNNPHRPPTPAASGTAAGCFNGTMCHNNAGAPHAPGDAWLVAGTGFHGTDAKADLTYCQGCHGTPGTIDFNGGSAPTACSTSTCHPAAKAHPTDWQASRTINGVAISHRSSGNRDVACAICHKVDAAGAGPNPSAPSCFSSSFTNDLGQARPCHSGGPGSAPHALGEPWLDPATGGTSFHGTEAKADLLVCQTCHGTPPRGFAGGTGATTACTDCHTTADAHPTDWQGIRAISTASITHRNSGNRAVACGICHNVAAAGTGPDPGAPSCFSADFTNGNGQARTCHASGPGEPNHPVPFFADTTHTQATTATFAGNCVTCHDATGTSPKSGPVCTTCHISDPRNVTNCTSCHADPPSGGTTAYPNVAGSHAKHLALNNATNPGTPVACATCHTGLGTGTLSHYNRTRPPRSSPASVAFVATIYNAKTGAAAFDNSSLLRCTNVSCHGGQAAPNWRTGTINVNTQCSSCHVYSPASNPTQYNGPTSIRHNNISEHRNAACTVCHNMATGSTGATGHFTSLNTPTLEGPAGTTITGTRILTYVDSTNRCTPNNSGGGCHSSTQTW